MIIGITTTVLVFLMNAAIVISIVSYICIINAIHGCVN